MARLTFPVFRVNLIKAVENAVYFSCRDTGSLVLHAKLPSFTRHFPFKKGKPGCILFPISFRRANPQFDFIAFRGVFEGIRQEVAKQRLQFFRVKIQLQLVRPINQPDPAVLSFGQTLVGFNDGQKIGNDILLDIMHRHGACLKFREAQHLIDQLEETVPVLPDQPQPGPEMIGRLCLYLVGHAQYDRQGRAEFMGYVGVKPGFQRRQFLNALLFSLFDFSILPDRVPEH